MFFEKNRKFFQYPKKTTHRSAEEVENFGNETDGCVHALQHKRAEEQKIEDASAEGQHGHIKPLLSVPCRKPEPEDASAADKSKEQLHDDAKKARSTVPPDHAEYIKQDAKTCPQ